MKPSTNMAIALALAAFILVRVGLDSPSLPGSLMTLSALAFIFLVMFLDSQQLKDDKDSITNRVKALENDISSLRSAINLKRQ